MFSLVSPWVDYTLYCINNCDIPKLIQERFRIHIPTFLLSMYIDSPRPLASSPSTLTYGELRFYTFWVVEIHKVPNSLQMSLHQLLWIVFLVEYIPQVGYVKDLRLQDLLYMSASLWGISPWFQDKSNDFNGVVILVRENYHEFHLTCYFFLVVCSLLFFLLYTQSFEFRLFVCILLM